ncbi:MAG: response regulator [Phycisphaeraceae bacterium]|nr:response regulator [Phycisphaeraceae bacterium]
MTSSDAPPEAATTGDVPQLIEAIADGVGVVEASGEILWMNNRLAAQPPEVMARFSDACRDQMRDGMAVPRRAHTRRFSVASRRFEVIISPFVGGPGATLRAVGVLCETTARERLADRVRAIDTAGASLLALDARILNPLNVAERLKLLEGRITQALKSIFGSDHFELRLLNRESGQLELVIGHGIEPLRIGTNLFARPEGNGLTGVVASSGESILTPDISNEPRYMTGLTNAKSSLVVALKLDERVVGTLNLESTSASKFDDEDRLLLELYGRYTAMALTILDMLIVERYTTNQRVSGSLREEMAVPVHAVRNGLSRLRLRLGDDADAASILTEIERSLESVEERVRNCTSGPRSVLGLDRLDRERGKDTVISGRRVLVADDEAPIRETIQSVLGDAGALVEGFGSGVAAIEAIQKAAAASRPFELVLSDVRIPDRNGYEIFRAAKDASPATAVILMTGFGYDPNHSIVRSSQEGLSCFLFKPFQATQLVEEVRKALSPETDAGLPAG